MWQDNTSVMTKVTATLGRNFIKSKEFQEAQLMGLDPVASQNGSQSSASLKEKQRSIR
jgi:myosin-7